MKWRDGFSITEMGMSEKGTGLEETKLKVRGTSLLVQWLGLCAASARGMGSILEKVRSHMLCGMLKKKKKELKVRF